MAEWLPIEKAPKDGGTYVVAVAGQDQWFIAAWLEGAWHEDGFVARPQPDFYLPVPGWPKTLERGA